MLDAFGVLLTLFLALLSVVNIFLLIYTAYQGFMIKLFHHNFRVLQLQVIASFLIISLGCIVFCSMIIVQGSLMVGDAYFQVIQMFMLYGDCSLRPISFAFVVERTFATVKREIYEKREYKWVSYGLIAIIQIITTFLVMLLYYWMINTYVFIGITLVIDVKNLGFIYYLRFWNIKLRRITMKTNLVLSYRYQVTENIRAVDTICPLLITCTIFNILSMGYAMISLPTGFLLNYVVLIFYGIMNINVVVCLILTLMKNNIYREKVLHRLPLLKNLFNKENSSKKITKVMNVEGKSIIHVVNEKGHFDMLRQAWK